MKHAIVCLLVVVFAGLLASVGVHGRHHKDLDRSLAYGRHHKRFHSRDKSVLHRGVSPKSRQKSLTRKRDKTWFGPVEKGECSMPEDSTEIMLMADSKPSDLCTKTGTTFCVCVSNQPMKRGGWRRRRWHQRVISEEDEDEDEVSYKLKCGSCQLKFVPERQNYRRRYHDLDEEEEEDEDNDEGLEAVDDDKEHGGHDGSHETVEDEGWLRDFHGGDEVVDEEVLATMTEEASSPNRLKIQKRKF